MMRLDIYQYGAGYRVRLHQHVGERDSECCDECEEHHLARVYAERDASPAEHRALVVAGVTDALSARGWGHVEFLRALGPGTTLF